MASGATGNYNTAVGDSALQSNAPSENTAVGYSAGQFPRLSPQNRPYIITSKPANEVSRRTEVLFYHGPFFQATNSRQQLPNGGGR